MLITVRYGTQRHDFHIVCNTIDSDLIVSFCPDNTRNVSAMESSFIINKYIIISVIFIIEIFIIIFYDIITIIFWSNFFCIGFSLFTINKIFKPIHEFFIGNFQHFVCFHQSIQCIFCIHCFSDHSILLFQVLYR